MENLEKNPFAFEGLITSAETDKLDAALALAQSKFEVAEKNKTNPHFRSKYADLTSIREAAKKGLAEAKVSVTQWLHNSSDNRLHIVTRVAHAGQYMQSSFAIPVGRQDAHGYGSAATYAKRYALSAALGIDSDEDDDGNAAAQPQKAKNPPPREHSKPKNFAENAKVTIKQVQMLFAANDKYGLKVDEMRDMIKTLTGKESTKDLTQGELNKILGLYKQYPNKDDLAKAVVANSQPPSFDEAEESPF